MPTFTVSGMRCGGCVSSVKEKLEAIPGCDSADVDLESATAVVSGDVSVQAIIDTLNAAGYPATLAD